MSSLATMLNRLLQLQIATDAAITDYATRGAQVALYREYDAGSHANQLSQEMREVLRIGERDDYTFSANYMPVVINTLASRVTVASITADTEAATEWAQEVLDLNLFDRLQDVLHRATIRDGDSFLIVWWDDQAQRVRLTHEPAFDGTSGVIPIYYSDADTQPRAVIKIWQELLSKDGKLTARLRVNVFTEGMIRRYASALGNLSSVEPFEEADYPFEQAWVDRQGNPLPIPFVHFKNRPSGQYGISEINNAIVLQDALNRTLSSLLLAAEKQGFPNRVAFGFEPPAELAVGGWIAVGAGSLSKDQEARIETLPAGDLSQMLAAADFWISKIAATTSTPVPEMFGADNLSGEAFRQREASLLNKALSFQRHTGAAWEAALDLVWLVQDAYGTRPPDYTRFATRWHPSDLRSEEKTVNNAIAVMSTGAISRAEFLRMLAPVYGWDEARIEQIIRESEQDAMSAAAASTSAVPDFRMFADGVSDAADS